MDELCRRLVPPTLLSTPAGWRATRNEDGEDAEQSVARNADGVLVWVEQTAPDALRALYEHIRSADDALALDEKAFVFMTCARFIRPGVKSTASYSLNVWTEYERNVWTSPQNANLAADVLQLPVLRCQETDVVNRLLQSFIKPLFGATPSSKVNDATGRARKTDAAGLRAVSGGAPMEEDVLWKGGDVQRARSTKVLERELVLDDEKNLALGCESVLYVCCQSIARRAEQSKADDNPWTEAWPLVLPPLLQLLDDPSPRYRLIGARTLSETLLKDRESRSVGSLLLRTGVSSIFRQTLASSLTITSSRLAGALLQATAEAWIRLTYVTTTSTADAGRAQYEQLSQLMDEGVLRVWAYAPATITPDGFDDDATELGIVDASINVVTALASEMGVGVVRYMDVLLEYLTQQLADEQNVYLRKIKAANAILAIVTAAQACPTLATWCARCLTYAARCWVVLSEKHDNVREKTALQDALVGIVQALRKAQSTEVEMLLPRIRKLYPSVFVT